MQQIDPKRLTWLRRRQTRCQSAQLRRVGRLRQRMAVDRLSSPTRCRYSILAMPRDVMAETDTHREQLRQVITSALAILGRPRTKVRFDFTRTKMIYPGGMLLFLAYLQLMLLHFPGRVKARCFPQSLAAQLMRHFGVADQLGVAPAGSQPHHESVVNWRYLTGDFADGEKIAELIDGYRRDTSAKLPMVSTTCWPRP